MTDITPSAAPPMAAYRLFALLKADKFALVAACFLLVVVLCAIFGPLLLEGSAGGQNLRARNAPPFTLERGWENWCRKVGRPYVAGDWDTGPGYSATDRT